MSLTECPRCDTVLHHDQPDRLNRTLALTLATAEAQIAFGEHLASVLQPPLRIELTGDLGTGKTTLTRGILRGLGYAGPVRSPTYTLVESYALPTLELHHFDLYRLGDPDELEYLGLRDLLGATTIWIIEWPERGAGWLPAPDLRIQLTHQGTGRHLTLTALTAVSATLLANAVIVDATVVSTQHVQAAT